LQEAGGLPELLQLSPIGLHPFTLTHARTEPIAG
jgi:hypothetical protein